MEGMQTEITRRSVLLEALEDQEAKLSRCSVEGKKLIPMPGLQGMFREQLEKCRLLREMVQALENESVRRSIADWQRDEMDGKPMDVTVLDRVTKTDRVPPVEKPMKF